MCVCVGGGRVLKKPKVVLSFKKRLDLAFGGWSRSGPEVLFNRKRRKLTSSYVITFKISLQVNLKINCQITFAQFRLVLRLKKRKCED